MSEILEGNEPTEKPTTHNKKASLVAISMVLIVTVGLVIQTFIGYQNRSSKQLVDAPKERTRVADPITITDFEKEKIRADKNANNYAGKEEKEQRREQALVEMGRKENAVGEEVAKEIPYQDVYDQYKKKEIMRTLMARQSGMRPKLSEESKKLNKERSTDKTISHVGVPDTQQKLADAREKQKNVNDLRNTIANQIAMYKSGGFQPNMAGMRPGLFPSASTSSETTGNQVVGEPVVNRGNKENRPRPGEILLPTGSVLSGVLDMDLISDYDGSWRGLLTRDVYDINKEYVLMPKGTKFTGKTIRITNVNEPIQARMAMGVTWAVLPNGNRIDFTKMSTLDHAGVSAIKGDVNYHILAQLAGLTAYAVLGATPSLTLSTDGESLSSSEQALSEITGAFRDQFGSLASRYLNLVPTITIKAGTPFKIFTEDDLYIKPWSRIDNTIFTTMR